MEGNITSGEQFTHVHHMLLKGVIFMTLFTMRGTAQDILMESQQKGLVVNGVGALAVQLDLELVKVLINDKQNGVKPH